LPAILIALMKPTTTPSTIPTRVKAGPVSSLLSKMTPDKRNIIGKNTRDTLMDEASLSNLKVFLKSALFFCISSYKKNRQSMPIATNCSLEALSSQHEFKQLFQIFHLNADNINIPKDRDTLLIQLTLL